MTVIINMFGTIYNLCVTHIDYAARNALKIKNETTHFIVRWRRIHEDGV